MLNDALLCRLIATRRNSGRLSEKAMRNDTEGEKERNRLGEKLYELSSNEHSNLGWMLAGALIVGEQEPRSDLEALKKVRVPLNLKSIPNFMWIINSFLSRLFKFKEGNYISMSISLNNCVGFHIPNINNQLSIIQNRKIWRHQQPNFKWSKFKIIAILKFF